MIHDPLKQRDLLKKRKGLLSRETDRDRERAKERDRERE